jgi:hypothetical protein
LSQAWKPATCVRTLAVDQQVISPRVTIKTIQAHLRLATRHQADICSERFALAAFERFHELGNSGFTERLGLFGRHITPPVPSLGESDGHQAAAPSASAFDGRSSLAIEVTLTSVIDFLTSAALFSAGCILAGADLAFELNVRALGERSCELAELPPDDTAMPGRLRLALTRLAILPATLRSTESTGNDALLR